MTEPEAAPPSAPEPESDTPHADAEAAKPAEPADSRPRPRRRGALVLLVAGLALAAWASFGPAAPKDNTVRFVLGDRAADVTELDVRYLDGEDLVREASFRYAPGAAPRIASHEVRAKVGDYRVEISITTRNGPKSFDKKLRLEGGTTQVDLVPALVR